MLWKKEIETKKLPDNCRLYTHISSARRGSLMHWKYDVHNISFIHFLKEEKIDHLYWYKQKKSLKNQLPINYSKLDWKRRRTSYRTVISNCNIIITKKKYYMITDRKLRDSCFLHYLPHSQMCLSHFRRCWDLKRNNGITHDGC